MSEFTIPTGQRTVFFEARNETDVRHTRQGAIGQGLLELNILPIYADVEAIDPHSRSLSQAMVLTPDQTLTPVTFREPVSHFDAYRIRALGPEKRPAFLDGTPGYNDPTLCAKLNGRSAIHSLLSTIVRQADLPEVLPPTKVIPPVDPLFGQRSVQFDSSFESAAYLLKPGDANLNLDVALEDPKQPQQRSLLVPHEALNEALNDPRLRGSVVVQPAIQAPSSVLLERLPMIEPPEDIAERPFNMVRVYHMIGSGFANNPDVVEVRFIAPYDIGQRDPSHRQLLSSRDCFTALPDLMELHNELAMRIGWRGKGYLAFDYFLAPSGFKINTIHTRAYTPPLANNNPLTRKTIATEVAVLGHLTTITTE